MATKAKRAIPEGFHNVNVSLTVGGAAKAIDWYKQVFGAEEIDRMEGPPGQIAHAELKIGDCRVMIGDPMMGAKDAKTLGGSPVRLVHYSENADAIWKRATEAGAKPTMPIADMFWGDRWGNFVDPFGFEWSVATRKQDLTREELEKASHDFMKQMAQKGGQH